MDKQEADLLADPLFVGLTRPTMKAGVTFQGNVINLMITTCAYIITKNLLYLGICLPIHGVFYAICAHDPRAFELLILWFRTRFLNLLSYQFKPYWKSSSYSPLEQRDVSDKSNRKVWFGVAIAILVLLSLPL